MQDVKSTSEQALEQNDAMPEGFGTVARKEVKPENTETQRQGGSDKVEPTDEQKERDEAKELGVTVEDLRRAKATAADGNTELGKEQTERVNAVDPRNATDPSETEKALAAGVEMRPAESERAGGANPIGDRMGEMERRAVALDSGREYTVPQNPEPTDGVKAPGAPQLAPAGANRDNAVTNGHEAQNRPNRGRNSGKATDGETLSEERTNDGGVDASKTDHMIGSAKATEGTGHVNDSVTEAMRGTSG